jgi:hypothetical protein
MSKQPNRSELKEMIKTNKLTIETFLFFLGFCDLEKVLTIQSGWRLKYPEAENWIRDEKIALGKAIAKEGRANRASPEQIERAQRNLIRYTF